MIKLNRLISEYRIKVEHAICEVKCYKVVSDLRQVNGFLRVLQFSPRIKLIDILLKGALNTMNQLP
jgi:hypothetical protein